MAAVQVKFFYEKMCKIRNMVTSNELYATVPCFTWLWYGIRAIWMENFLEVLAIYSSLYFHHDVFNEGFSSYIPVSVKFTTIIS